MPRLERELHGLAHGQLGEQGRGLERAAEPGPGAVVRGQLGDIAPEELDGARNRSEAADRVEQGRLAGPVRADETDHLTGIGMEVDPVDRDDAAVANRERARRDRAAVVVENERAGCRDACQRRGWRSPRLQWTLGETLLEPAQDHPPQRVAELRETAGEVEQHDQQPDARGKQQHGLVVGPERREPDHPERTCDRAGQAAQATDHRDRHDVERVGHGVEPFAVRNGDRDTTEQRAAEARDESRERECGELRLGRRNRERGRALLVLAHADDHAPHPGPAQMTGDEQHQDQTREHEEVVVAVEVGEIDRPELPARKLTVSESARPVKIGRENR